ncbi:hypothetical protein JCM11491_006559 [Sporobolomyces phaffii]
MSFPSTSSAFSNFATTRSPFASRSPHEVGFGTVPGSQPGVLSWSIGMSGANRNGTGWSSPASAPAPAPVQWGTSTTSRRRRRSDTPPEPDSPTTTTTTTTTATKRTRRVSEGLAHGLAGSLSLGTSTPTSQDLGKALAQLDKPTLLSILSSVLTTHPHLAPTVHALLPAPTLASTLDAISHRTRDVLAQIPLNSSPAYTYSRVRVALEAFVHESRALVSTYVPTTLPAPPSSTSTSELHHPTTTMAFLVHLTDAYLSIARELPPPPTPAANPLAQHLLPIVINSFHVFVTRVSASVNDHAKILAESTVRHWFEQLDLVVRPRSSPDSDNEAVRVATKAVEGVRDRMRKQIGWLVGYKPDPDPVHGMEGLEEDEDEL